MNRTTILSLFVAILLIGLILRLVPLQYPSPWAEPDVLIYAYIANMTLHNNFQIPATTLSGVPPKPYPEGLPLVYIPAILAYLSGQSTYSIIGWLAPFISLFGIPLAYLLTYELSKNKYASLYAAFLYAIMPAVLYRGSYGEWRGGVTVPILLGYSFLMLIYAYNKKRVAYGFGFAALFITAFFWWNGALYIIPCAGLLLVAYIMYKVLTPYIEGRRLNMAIHLILVLLSILTIVVAYGYVIGNSGPDGQVAVAEAAPPSVFSIYVYYGFWASFFALAGFFVVLWYGNTRQYNIANYAILALALPTSMLQVLELRWMSLFALPFIIYAAYGTYALIRLLHINGRGLVMILALAIAIPAYGSISFVSQFAPAPNLTPQLFNASNWIAQNTPSNALILTLWPDGSVVEALGHRESYSDSIMGGTQMPAFGQFLYAKAGNYSFLESQLDKSRPNYFLVRKSWLYEQTAIVAEAFDTSNSMSVNGTNFQMFILGKAPFPVVYSNNDITIYNISRFGK